MLLRSFFVTLLLVPMAAWADIRGIDLYARGDFAKAAPVLEEEADNPARSDKERARARIYAAASMYALGRMDDAREQLELLARHYPEQRVDPRRFAPDFVALADLARKTVETERLRDEARVQEAEQERLAAEAERRRREAEAGQQPGPDGEVQESAEPGAPSFRLRPEVTAFTDALAAIEGPKFPFGVALGVTAGSGAVEGTGRFLLGVGKGVELEAGLVFGGGAFKPRVGLRGTAVTNLRKDPLDLSSEKSWALGGGPVVGARLTLSPGLTVLVDGGLEFFHYFDITEARYRSPVVMVSAGLGYDLL
ncbi:MAG TPA: hypothetical protein VF794_21075 [Archangium sp.]|jgi:hypothetical protein|uniref:hypothetical protein n=1 Tax=Archangium sp. TaxID=1872627 RepID=UPI002EDB9722